MKILIINIDSKMPNLALKKIEKYHKDKGHEVIWDFPLARHAVDKIYVSSIFDWNAIRCKEWEGIAEIGGSGWDLTTELPPEIERVKPRINLGFTTRGCIRKCSFCVVPKKEGYIRVIGDLLDLWDGKTRKIIVLDNNILALPDHFAMVCQQAMDNKIRVDFNQGLDFRLLTPEIVELMARTPHIKYHFAFDHPSYLPGVERAIKLLHKNKIVCSTWYVLSGYNTTFLEDLDRTEYLRSKGENAFIQRYHTVMHTPEYVLLAQWANQHHIYHGMDWETFITKWRPTKVEYLMDKGYLRS